jgi:PAS domain S-box-containing protein
LKFGEKKGYETMLRNGGRISSGRYIICLLYISAIRGVKMSIFALLSLLAFVLSVFLGNFVYYIDKRKPLNRIFMLFCLFMAYWAFTEFMCRQADNPDTAYLWVKMNNLWYFAPAFMVHFALVFSEKKKLLKNRLVYFPVYVPALIFSFIGFTNLTGVGLVKEFWGYTYGVPENSWLYWIGVIWAAGLGFLALILCFEYYLKATDKKKKLQARYVSIGFFIPVFVSALTEGLFPALEIKVPELSTISTTGLAIFVGYAIWKHELFTLSPAIAAENIVSTMPDALILADPEGKILRVNQSLLNFLGYNEDELFGKSLNKLCAEEQCGGKILTELLKNGILKNYEIKYKTKSGEEKHVSFSGSTVRSKEGQIVGIACIIRDITERKLMEYELKRYSEHLEELVEKRTRELKETHEQLLKAERFAAIGEVAAMVGHDLKNPLQSIENATYYLNNELPHLSSTSPNLKKAMEMLRVINDSANYADNIIRDLQDFSATKKPILKKIDINTLVKDTLSQIEAPENVELCTELDYLPEIEGDEDQIKRVFMNLAVNGIQAMENGGTLTVSTKKTGGFVEISFKDTGIGISKESMKKLFTPFFTTKAKGMGLGLPICKKFVESHGGGIEVESEVGKETTFTIKLPIQQKSQTEKMTEEKVTERIKTRARKLEEAE